MTTHNEASQSTRAELADALAALLDQFDPHGVYDQATVARWAEKQGLKVLPATAPGGEAQVSFSARGETITGRFATGIVSRFAPDTPLDTDEDANLVTGASLSADLASMIFETDPGEVKYGADAAHKERIEALDRAASEDDD